MKVIESKSRSKKLTFQTLEDVDLFRFLPDEFGTFGSGFYKGIWMKVDKYAVNLATRAMFTPIIEVFVERTDGTFTED